MSTQTASDTETSVRFLDELFAESPLEKVSFQFWDGTRWPDESPRPATLVLRHPGALREMFASGTEKGLAEAYLRDDFDVGGEIEEAFELADVLGRRSGPHWLKTLTTLYRLSQLPGRPEPGAAAPAFRDGRARRHSLERDRQAVSFHYDVSNDFYGLWLDRRMLYSCAYFERPGDDLDTAQTAKLRHLCRKLRLRPGQRVLDIGCGWGGFAIYAAQEHGVEVTGITLSREQADLAAARVRAAGLGGRVAILRRDYRELEAAGSFDAIVSVGMSEHVGRDHLAEYFAAGARLLKAGGVFLNHAIGEGVRPRPRQGPSFIEEYVFPDSDIPPLPAVARAAESAGLEIRDVENLREHYALTLRHWVRRLETAHEAARAFVDEASYRVWRLYLAGSAHSFDRGQLAIYQALLSKPDPAGRAHLPLTRGDWYSR